jgi:hypothetical protein
LLLNVHISHVSLNNLSRFLAGAAGLFSGVIFEVFSVPPTRPKVNDFQAFEVQKKEVKNGRVNGAAVFSF